MHNTTAVFAEALIEGFPVAHIKAIRHSKSFKSMGAATQPTQSA
jgi:hypothetical protein